MENNSVAVQPTVDLATDYQEFLTEIIATFTEMVAKGQRLTAADVVLNCDPNSDNAILREWVAEKSKAKLLNFGLRDYDRAIRNRRIEDALGAVPVNPRALVAQFVKKHQIVCRYDGTMTRDVKPVWYDDKGEPHVILPDDRQVDIIALHAEFLIDARKRMDQTDLERELRMISDDFHLQFSDRAIGDAVTEWMKQAQRERLLYIYNDTTMQWDARDHGDSWDREARWREIAERIFVTDDRITPDYIAAVLRKFMWQVKRKMRGMFISDHLMPVLLGDQGIGKSTLVRAMLACVDEVTLSADFRMVEDDRNVEIWNSYVLFLDEMGHASRSDVEIVKNAITATTLTRRPMRSNGKITIRQNATFIGCSNKELAQLIKDNTGNRRFVGIRMRSDADRQFINAIPWDQMWGSVDVNDPDPMAAFKTVLRHEQEATREVGRVESWMKDFGHDDAVDSATYERLKNSNGNIAAVDLYQVFRDYEDANYPGAYKLSKADWDQEMNRIRNNIPASMAFQKMGNSGGRAMWRWKNEAAVQAVRKR